MEHHRLTGSVHRRVALDRNSKPGGFLELLPRTFDAPAPFRWNVAPCGQSLLADQDPARGRPRVVLADRDHPAVEKQVLEVLRLDPVLLGVDGDVECSASPMGEGAGRDGPIGPEREKTFGFRLFSHGRPPPVRLRS